MIKTDISHSSPKAEEKDPYWVSQPRSGSLVAIQIQDRMTPVALLLSVDFKKNPGLLVIHTDICHSLPKAADKDPYLNFSFIADNLSQI